MTVAGLATMEILRRPDSYDRIQATGRTIMQALEQNFARVGIPAQVIGHPSLFDIIFIDRPVRNYRDFLAGDAVKMKRFNTLLRQRGILKLDSKFYISLAHDDADIAQTVDAIRFAADTMKGD
jgi:glutamate-1-semialdehyde 2,1-aminomutase